MAVTVASGRARSQSIRNCIGSRGRPMTDAKLDAKFRRISQGIPPEEQAAELLASVRGIEQAADAAAPMPARRETG